MGGETPDQCFTLTAECDRCSSEILLLSHFSEQIFSLSRSFYCHIRQLCCICSYLVSKTASTIATSIVYSKVNYCHSLYYNIPKSQLTRLQQIQNSHMSLSKVPNPATSLQSFAVFSGLRQPNTLNTSSFQLLTKYLLSPSLHICTTSSPFNLPATLAPHHL